MAGWLVVCDCWECSSLLLAVLIASGSNDKTVLVHSLTQDGELGCRHTHAHTLNTHMHTARHSATTFCVTSFAAPVKTFEGHKDAVSGVIFLRQHLISVSWDG